MTDEQVYQRLLVVRGALLGRGGLPAPILRSWLWLLAHHRPRTPAEADEITLAFEREYLPDLLNAIPRD